MRLKTELGYLVKLFRQSYPWRYYFDYFRYRFFSKPILARLPRWTCTLQANFELHLICQEEDLPMLEWSLLSFLNYSGLCPQIIIHDDGTIKPSSARKLIAKFNNLRVLFRSQADQMINQRSDIPLVIKQARQRGHRVLAQLVDVILLSAGRKIMVMDSDVLFFKRPEEIIKFVNGQTNYQALVSRQYGSYDLLMDKAYAQKHDLIAKQTGYMNPGFIAYDKASITKEMLVDYFQHTRRDPDSFFMPMAGWGCLLAQINFDFLSAEKYIMKGRPDANAVMKHFTGPRRHEFFAYGINLVRQTMKANRRHLQK